MLPQTYFLVKLNFRNILLSNLCHKMAPSLAILAFLFIKENIRKYKGNFQKRRFLIIWKKIEQNVF